MFDWRSAGQTSEMSRAQVYGGSGGLTPAAESKGGAVAAPANEVDSAVQVGLTGQPIAWWVGLLVFLGLFMYVTDRLTPSTSFGQLKLSVYNIFVITLAVFIGVPFFKVVFTKWKVKGLSAVVHSV